MKEPDVKAARMGAEYELYISMIIDFVKSRWTENCLAVGLISTRLAGGLHVPCSVG